MKGKAYIDAGICGFEAPVVTEAQGPLVKAQVLIFTECPNLKSLIKSSEIEIMDIVQKRCRGVRCFLNGENCRRTCTAKGRTSFSFKGVI